LPYQKETDLYCMASMQAPEYETEERTERAGIDLVCVIDKSGSMSGSKIELVKSTLAFMFEQLKDTDRVALVEFDSSVATSMNFTKMNDEGRNYAKKVAGNIRAGTCTNLSGGLFQGLNLIKNRTEANEITSVLLFTDGLANEGVTVTSEIVSRMNTIIHEEIRKNISVFSFGFGNDTDANMLTNISQAGNGLYYFLQTVDDIPKAFGNVIGGLVSVVGQNIKVKIEPKSNIRLKKVFTTYRKQDLPGGTGCEVNIGDIYAEEKKDIVFVLTLPALMTPITQQHLAQVTLSYMNVIETEAEAVTFDVFVNRDITTDPDRKSANYALDIQRNRVESSEALEKGRSLADSNNLTEARKVVNDAIKKIQESVSANDEFCQGLIKDLNDCLKNMENQHTYTNIGSKMMANQWMANMQQRSTNACESSSVQSAYHSKKKSAMVSKFVNHK